MCVCVCFFVDACVISVYAHSFVNLSPSLSVSCSLSLSLSVSVQLFAVMFACVFALSLSLSHSPCALLKHAQAGVHMTSHCTDCRKEVNPDMDLKLHETFVIAKCLYKLYKYLNETSVPHTIAQMS